MSVYELLVGDVVQV